ncbi:MAG: EF-P lysine aminoacylase GenX, partial [Alphaproteobacteria bacterium]|nr:EF-P lysine aminoacylase GenX [Alphaproteobacteria bacterium]
MTQPWWSPSSLGARRGNLALRARAKSAVSDWFYTAGFTEVETPALQISPGLEA